MRSRSILIISLKPLIPVRSGMQNTIYLLYKYLKIKKFKIFFLEVKTNNSIDPILNLNYRKNIEIKIKKKIKLLKPNLIFVNTSKLLFLYNDILIDKKKNFKTILISHDLYFFRKKYFSSINIKDKTPLSNQREISTLKKVNHIIDISEEEKKHLLKNKISKSKIIHTFTPTKKFQKINLTTKKKYDILYISGKWKQNKFNILNTLKILKLEKNNLKLLIVGSPPLFLKNSKNISKKKYNQRNLRTAKLGVALIKKGSGRNTKIFEMLALGLPILTNINLKDYKLKNLHHYFLINNMTKINQSFKTLLADINLRKKLSRNAYNWSKKHSYFKIAFRGLNKILY